MLRWGSNETIFLLEFTLCLLFEVVAVIWGIRLKIGQNSGTLVPYCSFNIFGSYFSTEMGYFGLKQ